VAADASQESVVRAAAVELLLCCCSGAPASVRRVTGFAESFLRLCMGMCAAVDEDISEWEANLVRRSWAWGSSSLRPC
jgi:hypothetical protein